MDLDSDEKLIETFSPIFDWAEGKPKQSTSEDVDPPWADNDNERKLDDQEDKQLEQELEKSQQEDTGPLPEQVG